LRIKPHYFDCMKIIHHKRMIFIHHKLSRIVFMILGLEKGIVRLVAYCPEWVDIFEEEKRLLINTIGNYIIDIQHIGSTAIPDIIAKPIIDISIAIADFDEGKRCIEPTESLGYIYKGENGITRRHYFVKGDPTAYHLHIVEHKSEEWRKNIIFRDTLRADKSLADKYAKLKMELAEKFGNNREAYTDGKTQFVKNVLEMPSKRSILAISD
jgi:GrpB-like predicted nucleotidyltransferase (UPF0157 family)